MVMANTVHLTDDQWSRIEQRIAAAKPPRPDDTGVQDSVTGEDLSASEVDRRRAAYRAERT